MEVTRSGGFAGISRSSSAPEDELPADLQQPLRRLLTAPPDTPGAPDRFVYTLKHGDQQVTVGEKALDDDGKRLMQWVLARKA
ncbi:MAG TPA: protealysin inhibitor emfourin [Frankiaceae bacterium]|nr:protealysin inhibitor emfourin [Frankiaceae bacterium]